jgi:putative FmdB family regulatory protein
MPIYEYRCENCGHELDALQKISDAPLVECPACGHSALKKLVSVAAFRLKGGGWYETDFKSANKKNLHDAGERDTGGKGAGAVAKEAKKEPEAKPTSNAKTGGGQTKAAGAVDP